MKNKKGFTLVELIVVIAVMAIITMIVVPKMNDVMGSVKKRSDQRAGEMYYKKLRMQAHLGKLSTAATETTLTENILDDDYNNDGDKSDVVFSESDMTKKFTYKYTNSELEIFVDGNKIDTASGTVISLEFQ